MASMGGFFAGSIFAKLTLDRTSFSAAITAVDKEIKTFSGSLGKVSKSLDGMGKGLSKAGRELTMSVTAPLLAIGGASLKMAMDAVESENLFTVSMKGMAAAGREWSNEISKALGLNQYEIRKTLGTFNVMFSSMGLGEKAAYDMAKGLTQLTYDMASFYNLKPEEAFLKLQSGISGEIEPLKRLGIIVNETTVKQWAMTHGIITQGQELTEQQKVMVRYNVILEKTKDAQGDLARTIDSPTNKLRSLKSQAQEMGVELGLRLIPLFEKVMNVVQDGLKWWDSLSSKQQDLYIKIGLVAAALGPMLSLLGKIFSISSLAVKGLKLLVDQCGGLGTKVTGANQVLGKIGAIGASAFVGWKIGEVIGDVTGLNKVLQNAFEKVANLVGIGKAMNAEWLAGHTAAQAKQQEALARATELSGEKVKNSVEAWKVLRDEYTKTGTTGSAALDEVVKKQIEGREEAKKHHQEIAKQKKGFEDGKISSDAFADSLANVTKNQANLAEELGLMLKIDLEKKIKKYEEALKKYKDQLPIKEEERLTKELKEMSDEMATGGRVTDMLAQRFKNLKPKIVDLYPALDNLGAHAKAGCGAAGRAVAELSDGIKIETGKQEGYFDGMLSDVARNFGQTFQDILTGHISFKDGLKQIWDSIKQTFFDMIGEMVTRWITGFLDQIFNKTKDTTGQVSGLFGGMSASMAAAIGFVALQYGVFLDMMSHTPWDFMGDKINEQINMWQSWGLSIDEINKKLQAMIISLEKAWALESGSGIGRGRRGGEEGEEEERGGRKPGGGNKGETIGSFQHGGIAWREQIVRIAEKGPEIIWPLNNLDEILPAPIKEECKVDVHIKPLLIKRGDIVEIDFIVETMNKAVRRGEFTMPAFALKGA